MLVQVRLHGRGGQGTVTAAEMLAVAAFEDGRYAQAFPSFGSERTGAPVEAYCRISSQAIRTREPVAHPDILIVQDPTLIGQVRNLFTGLQPDGFLLVNSVEPIDDLPTVDAVAALPHGHILYVAATQIARDYIGRNTPNTALLGGFAAMNDLVSYDAVCAAVSHRFSGAIAEKNLQAVKVAFEYVSSQREELTRAQAN